MRNRLKRRLRELSRLRLLSRQFTADVVIRIRPEAYRASFAELGRDMDRAVNQLMRWAEQVNAQDGTPKNALPDPHLGGT